MSYHRRAHDAAFARAPEAEDPITELLIYLREKLEPDEYTRAEELVSRCCGMGTDGPPAFKPNGMGRNGLTAQDGGRVYAMDATDPVRRMQDISAAEREVAPVVGPVLGMDSAAGVFRTALRRLGVDADDLPARALPAMWKVARRGHDGGAVSNSVRPYTPQSSADFARRFPEAARIRTL